MYYGEVKDCDIANGAGVRVTLFVSGCRNHCEHCFQPQTWDFDYGKQFTKETENYILGLLERSYIKGLTILGGDPFEPENQRELLPFMRRVKDSFPEKTIWVFSGYTLDVLEGKPEPDSPSEGHVGEEDYKPPFVHAAGPDPRTALTDEMLSLTDVLIDGPFVQSEKDITLRFRGSRNQRLIDMNATRAALNNAPTPSGLSKYAVQLPDRVSSARRNISAR